MSAHSSTLAWKIPWTEQPGGHSSWGHRARTNNFTICMEIQKTSNSQSDLEKEEWN